MTTPAPQLSPADLGIGRRFGAVHEALIAADVATGRIVLWNPAAEKLFGYSAAEAADLPLEALVPDRLKARHRAGFARYRETGRGPLIEAGRPLELPALRKDGTERTMELTLSLIDDVPGGGRVVLAIIRDVTDRTAEEETARRLATVVESSEDAIVSTTLDGVITSWNSGAERLYGYAAREAVGQNFALLVPPDRADEVPGLLARLRRGERIRQYETQRVRKDGRRIDVSLSISPVRDAAGRPVGTSGIARDITERKRAEDARIALAREQAARAAAEAAAAELAIERDRLRSEIAAREQAEEALRQREQLLQGVIDSSTAVIYVKDTQGRYITVNRQFEQLFHITRAEAHGKTDYDVHPPQIAAAHQANDRQVLDAGTPLEREEEAAPDGRVHTYISIKFPLRDTTGTPYAVCGISTDITERKRAEAELARVHEAERRTRAEAESGRQRALLLAAASRAFVEAGPEVRPVLEVVAQRLVETLGDGCGIRLLVTGRQPLELVAVVDRDPDAQALAWELLDSRPPRVGQGLAGRVVQSGEPLLLSEVSLDELRARVRPEHWPLLEQSGLGSLMVAPLRARGRAIGTLYMWRRATSPPYTHDELALLMELADRAALAVENARLYGALAAREQQLQELVGRMILAQEEERRRVAYEVHDGVAQVVAGTHLQLRAFARRYRPRRPQARAELDHAVELAQRAVREARTVVGALRPTVLDDLGLEAALEAEVEELRKAGWRVELKAELGPKRLAPAVETALFRVAQEALHNAHKHAGTDRACVLVRRTRRAVRLEVRDWGRGFRPEAAAAAGTGPGERVGLSGMKERVALLGGRCEVRSRPGAGTRIVAEVPLHVPKGAGAMATTARGAASGGVRHDADGDHRPP